MRFEDLQNGMIRPQDLRKMSEQIRTGALKADGVMYPEKLGDLANALEAYNKADEQYRVAYDKAIMNFKDPLKEASAEIGLWERETNNLDRAWDALYSNDIKI